MKNDLILGIIIGASAVIILTRRSKPAPAIIQPTVQHGRHLPLPAGNSGNLTGYRGNVMIARKPQRPQTYNQLTNPGYPMPGWQAI